MGRLINRKLRHIYIRASLRLAVLPKRNQVGFTTLRPKFNRKIHFKRIQPPTGAHNIRHERLATAQDRQPAHGWQEHTPRGAPPHLLRAQGLQQPRRRPRAKRERELEVRDLVRELEEAVIREDVVAFQVNEFEGECAQIREPTRVDVERPNEHDEDVPHGHIRALVRQGRSESGGTGPRVDRGVLDSKMDGTAGELLRGLGCVVEAGLAGDPEVDPEVGMARDMDVLERYAGEYARPCLVHERRGRHEGDAVVCRQR